MASNAVGQERISQVVGYQLTAGDFLETTPNLPQRIIVLGESNTANQTGLTPGKEIKSAKEAGETYGFGSPIHQAMRILRPASGGGVKGIPTIVFNELESGGAVAQTRTITVTGAPTTPGTQNVRVAGRTILDGQVYSFPVSIGDTVTQIASSIADAINNVLGSPFTATSALGVVTLVTKWKGSSSISCQVELDEDNPDLGVTYAVVGTVVGSGDPGFAAALAAIGEEWSTIVVNCSELSNTNVLDALESKNGKPSATTPTGNYTPTIMRPFIALTGSLSVDESAITDARKDEVTIAVCPAPNSLGMHVESAANMAVLFSRRAQDNPHLDVTGLIYPDMPGAPGNDIGSMGIYDNRDILVKKGSSTVALLDGKYLIKDFVTTYHPVGEITPQHRYCRDLMLDFNVFFGYFLLEETNVVGHVLVADDDDVQAAKVIKPKMWVAILDQYALDLASRALITEPKFMQDSILVNLGLTNPNRLESFFRYKRSGTVRIASTTAEAGFSFGG